MTAAPDVVLVSSSDENQRRLITNALRDRLPVRTATGAESTVASLDASIAVVVIDGATVDLSVDALDTDDERTFYQILWLDSSGAAPTERADAVFDRAVSRETIWTTVERLQLRARYDRLLTTFYELAAAEERTDTVHDREQKLDAVKDQLDRVAARLDDRDAFDIALDT
mgnify:CR=1 FL=1